MLQLGDTRKKNIEIIERRASSYLVIIFNYTLNIFLLYFSLDSNRLINAVIWPSNKIIRISA